MRRAIQSLTAVLTITASCELGEINIPPSEPIVVVQAVMRPDLSQQWIIVEQTLTGRILSQGTADVIPGGRHPLQAPIQDARVLVSNINFPSDPCGSAVTFTQSPPVGESRMAGVYWGPLNCPTMRAGDTLELRVEALDSIVSARTEIPGVNRTILETELGSATSPMTTLTFNRDTDTLRARVESTHGRALHVELFQNRQVDTDSASDIGESSAWFFVDSTEVTLPGDLVNFFEIDADFGGGFAPDLFIAGLDYTVTTAFMDQNLFDNFRSANFPLSGRGYINRISGGFGLFGSLVSQTNGLRIIGDIDDPREGTYQLSGVVSGTSVNIELELYVGRQWVPNDPRDPLGAFVTGNWVGGPINRSILGWFDGINVELIVDIPAGGDFALFYFVRGSLNDGSTLAVFQPEGTPDGTLTVRRQAASSKRSGGKR